MTSSGRKLRELRYSIEADNLLAPEMTVRADHIMRGGVEWSAWANEPTKSLLLGRADGQVLSFTYDRDQKVYGWARHIFGGSFGSGDAVAESGCVVPDPDNTRDEPYVIVKRTINGVTKRYLEFIGPSFVTGDDPDLAVYLDCAVTYDGAAASTFSGLDHLEGETVTVLGDGALVGTFTVTNGSIDISSYGLTVSKAVIGLDYLSLYVSMRVNPGANDGVSQGKRTRIKDIVYRVVNGRGGQGGISTTSLSDIPDLNYRNPQTLMGTAADLVTGDVKYRPKEKWTDEARLVYQTSEPFPVTLLALYPQVEVSEDRP